MELSMAIASKTAQPQIYMDEQPSKLNLPEISGEEISPFS